MILLQHPQHGTKIAYLESEAEADIKNGWVKVVKVVAEPAAPEPAEESAIIRRGPGRPRKEL